MITNWEQLPLVLDAHKLAELLDVDVETIYRRCSPKVRGTKREMRPAPYSWERPYRWYRPHVQAQLEHRAADVPVGRPSRRRSPFQKVRDIKNSLAVPA